MMDVCRPDTETARAVASALERRKSQKLLERETMAPVNDCIIHPLVLLNCVDHYNRVAKDTKKRVVGVLLGNIYWRHS